MIQIIEGKEYPKKTVSKVIIRFQDCDPLQHLNNAKYFDYFFNARDDQVAKLYEFNAADVFRTYKAGWVIYHHQISYIRPARVGEWVTIVSRLIFFNNSTIVVEYCMFDESQKELKTVLWSTMKYVDVRTGQKVEHQEDVKNFLKVMLDSEVNYEGLSFFDRIKNIKRSI